MPSSGNLLMNYSYSAQNRCCSLSEGLSIHEKSFRRTRISVMCSGPFISGQAAKMRHRQLCRHPHPHLLQARRPVRTISDVRWLFLPIDPNAGIQCHRCKGYKGAHERLTMVHLIHAQPIQLGCESRGHQKPCFQLIVQTG